MTVQVFTLVISCLIPGCIWFLRGRFLFSFFASVAWMMMMMMVCWSWRQQNVWALLELIARAAGFDKNT